MVRVRSSPENSSARSPGDSLRSQLAVLLCMMVVPFVLFSAYQAWNIHSDLEREVADEALLRAQNVGRTLDDYFMSTTELLKAVSLDRQVRAGQHDVVAAWFTEMLVDFPHYANIILVDNEGYIRAAGRHAPGATGPVNVSDTVYFQRAMSTNGPAIGEFMYGRITGAPVVHVCYPVYDLDGARTGFVAVATNLTRVQDRIMRETVPDHTTIAVMSETGTMIARNRDPESWVGTDVTDTMRVEFMRSAREGIDDITLPDGTEKVCGFTAASSVPWFVRVGVDRAHLRAAVANALLGHLIIFAPLLIIALSGWLWISRAVYREHRTLEELSLTDQLTGLWNVRKLKEDMRLEIVRASRAGSPTSFAMIDLDGFKRFNDRFGHPEGDVALKQVADTIVGSVRETDRVYRYGGEELSVLLPDTDACAAAEVADRIRQTIEDAVLHMEEHAHTARMTVSIGVATFPGAAGDSDALIRAADSALYRAKSAGRNRVVVHPGSGPL